MSTVVRAPARLARRAAAAWTGEITRGHESVSMVRGD